MLETSGQEQAVGKYSLGNLPPQGSPLVGRFFNRLWDTARGHKIDTLGLHKRWLENHRQFRGIREQSKYRRIGAGYFFKTIQGFCASLTEKQPKSEINSNDYEGDDVLVKALDLDASHWWDKSSQQDILYASVQNMQVYGTTIEKGRFDPNKNEVICELRDPFNVFPAPRHTRCDLKDLPYLCDVYFLPIWQIRQMFEVPENVTIPADAEDQLLGKARSKGMGGDNLRKLKMLERNYPTRFSDIEGEGRATGLEEQAMIIEIWVRDSSVQQAPQPQEQPGYTVNPTGTTLPGADGAMEELAQQGMEQQEEQPQGGGSIYPDGIRRVVIGDNGNLVYADSPNPNINWELYKQRQADLVQNGLPVPMIDPMSGQPVIDPMTGQPLMGVQEISPEEAEAIVYKQFTQMPFWGKFCYHAQASLVDSTQWWGFSIIEQLEAMIGEAEALLTQYFAHFRRIMFPTLINPEGSGVENSQITNSPALILRPTVTTANLIRYLEPPPPPMGLLEAVWFLIQQVDVVSGSPEVAEGRRPKGVSAASAIIALQDKAATLFGPQIRAVDTIIRKRGEMFVHFIQNFGVEERRVKVDDNLVRYLGVDLIGEFEFFTESGSSAPITKAGRRQQFIDLFQLGAMDVESLLEMLEIPKASVIVERLTEQNSLAGAIDILIQAGLPQETAHQLYAMLAQPQGGTGRAKPGINRLGKQQPTGPSSDASEATRSAFSEMRGGAHSSMV